MGIMTAFARKPAGHQDTVMDDRELTQLSACMAAMLDEIDALDLQGLLGDGFAAMGGTTAPAPDGTFETIVSFSENRGQKRASD